MMVATLVTLVFMCAVLITWGVSVRSRLLQFPFLATFSVTIQFIPQLVVLGMEEDAYPPGAVLRLGVMICLCLGMTAAGYFVARRPLQLFNWRYNEARLLGSAACLVIVGQVFAVLLMNLPPEMFGTGANGQWSGLPVAYLFLAGMASYGFAIALTLFARSWNWRALAIAVVPGLSTLGVALLGGRRSPAAALGMSILCVLWFSRRWTPPRWLWFLLMVLFGIFISDIGFYRSVMPNKDMDWVEKQETLREHDWFSTFSVDALREADLYEMGNAIYSMDAVSESGEYDFGKVFYNWMIMAYIPGQLVGAELKKSLMLDLSDPLRDISGFTRSIGTCMTGVAEAYLSFGYFGCLIFFALGYFMRRVWEAADRGMLAWQIIYLTIAPIFLGAYYGSLIAIVLPWQHILFFCITALYWARRPLLAPMPESGTRCTS